MNSRLLPSSRAAFRIGLLLLTAVVLVGWPRVWSAAPLVPSAVFIIAAALVAFCSNFPVLFPQTEINLSYVVAWVVLLIFGPLAAAWSLVAGLAVGIGARALGPSTQTIPADRWKLFIERLGLEITRQVLPLLAASSLYLGIGGEFPVADVATRTLLALCAFGAAYFALYNLLVALELDTSAGSALRFFLANLLPLSALELLPLPFTLYVAVGYHSFGLILLVIFSSALMVVSASLHTITRALAQRVQQLFALATISRELTATLDLQRLFDTLIARATEATRANIGKLGIADVAGDNLTFVAGYGLPTEVIEADRDSSWPAGRGLAGRVLRTGEAARIDDVHRDLTYAEANPGMQSQLGVPIMREERRLGLILLESKRRNAFTLEDQDFVRQLAVQAAVAIDNARLYNEVRARLREQSILYEAGSTLASTMDRQSVYPAVAQKLAEAIGADDCVISDYVLTTGKVETSWQLKPVTGSSHVVSAEYSLDTFPFLGRVLRKRKPLTVKLDDPEADPAELAMLQARGHGALLALPMIVSDQVVGLVEIYVIHPRDFSPGEISLAQTLANQAAIAIENARLFSRVMEGRDRLAAVLNSTREGMLVIDSLSMVLLVNPPLEEFWDISAERLLGQRLAGLLDDQEMDLPAKLGFKPKEIFELLQRLQAGQALGIPKTQYRLEIPNGRFLERSGAPVLDRFGKAIGWVIILRDVTEEKEIQEMQEMLTGMIVHDLRSPLTAMLGSLTLIRDRIPAESQSPVLKQALEVSLRSCNKLLHLVNTLLDLSHLETGQVTLKRSQVNLNSLVDEIFTDLMPLAKDQEIFMFNEVPSALPTVWVDREKLNRIFTNLIDNALKFTPPGGRIWVRGEGISQSDNGAATPLLKCVVRDTGPGIPADYQDKVFDRFAQVREQYGRREGTGLGLAFCKLAVEAHGGKIWVENDPEGGSAFYFTLPMLNGEGSDSGRSHAT
jgi:two-component system, NtrC family, sensor histidine kinase KinB